MRAWAAPHNIAAAVATQEIAGTGSDKAVGSEPTNERVDPGSAQQGVVVELAP